MYTKASIMNNAVASYWRAPDDVELYKSKSPFLAIANQEVDDKDPMLKQRMMEIPKIRHIQWLDDTVIVPKEGAHYGVWDENYNLLPL